MLTLAVVAAVVLALAGLYASYWGAGLLLYPPSMSAMEIFPERFNMPYDKVSFKTSDGLTLSGWWVPSLIGAERTLLVCHGWGDNKGELLEDTLFLNRDCGFNLFYFDFRGHGESAPSQVTLGKLELVDFAAAVAWLRANKPRHAANLGVFGLSMGASVAAMALHAHPELRLAVLESPFADFHTVGRRWAWNHFYVPYFPLVMITLYLARLRSGHEDLDTYSPQEFFGKARLPVLLIAGERDSLMPPDDVKRLYELAPGPKELWVVPQAGHARCREAAPAEYEQRVAAFLRERLAA